MLASLLPGLRELRAPLSAGYLWLLAAWVVFEPVTPERSEATGLVASLYRAGDLVSVLGLGVAASFVAYLLGSVSASTLTPLLRRGFPRAFDAPHDGPAVPRSPLSPAGRAALGQVARAGRERLTSSLALSGADVDRFLEKHTGIALPMSDLSLQEPEPKRPPGKMYVEDPRGPGYARPTSLDTRREALLALVVLRDLPVVATTRLLGRDQELYSAVDRNRAEVEFRLAVVPPLLVLLISLGARSELWAFALLAIGGTVLCWALFTDAVRSERAANEILLDSIADGRVSSPTLERLEMTAAELSSQNPPERMSRAATDAALALLGVAASLQTAFASESALAMDAQQLAVKATELITPVRARFPPAIADTADEALRLLSEVADSWVRVIEGGGPSDLDASRHLDRAGELIEQFRSEARDAVDQARASLPPAEHP